MSRLIAFAVLCALLTGCTVQTASREQDTATPSESGAPSASVPERPFPNDSLYALLVAEFALQRQAYEVALDQYSEQAPVLRDAGVSAHTTHLSQFLQQEEKALASAQLWVELEPENAEANTTLASLLVMQGRTLEALPLLAVVERQEGSANFPMLLNGFRQLTEEQRTELEQGINQLAVEFPDNTRLLLSLALISAEYGRYDQALDELQTLFKLEPEQPQAVLLEAKILAEQKAKDPYGRLQRLLRENPDASLLRLQFARMLTATDMVAARQQFEMLLAQSPRDGDLIFSLALISREIDDQEAASAYLHQVIALGQRVDEAYYYLGRIAEDDGNTEEAISNYMRVGQSREYLAANSRAGQILVKEGELDRSHAWFNKQREKNPEQRDQLYELEADILTQAGVAKNAMQVLDQALAETPDSTNLLYARAMASEEQDDLVSMERDLRAILAADPDNATALNALGYTLAARTTRYEEALQLISRALALQPDEPAILDSMGWVMFRTGRYDEALVYLTRAYTEFPDPEVAAHLAEVLWVKGETKAATTVLQGAALRDPDHPALRDTLDRLGVAVPRANPAEDADAGDPP